MNIIRYFALRLASLTMLGLAPIAASAQTICYVSPDGDNSSGSSWTTAFRTISNGVSHATGVTNTVLVSNGIYTVSTPILVYSGITVTSLNGRAWTFVNGGGASQCFKIDHPDAVVDGFTITNGVKVTGSYDTDGGGGVWIKRGVLRNCEISSNTCSRAGGGIYIDMSATNAQVINCVIKNNWGSLGTSKGGGISLAGTGTVVRGCTISGNTALFVGGGVCSLSGQGLITDCIISNNTCPSGAGICFSGESGNYGPCNWTSTYCTVVNNIGSGVYMAYQGNGTISDSTIANGTSYGVAFSGNSSNHPYLAKNCLIMGHTNSGARISSSGTIQNCQVVSNNAGSSGNAGGVHMVSGGRVLNCLIAYNSVDTVATKYGGGFYIDTMGAQTNGSTVSGCTIVSNVAYRGGGIAFVSSTLTNFVVDCIVASNKASNAGNDVYDYSPSTSSNAFYYSCIKVYTLAAGKNNITNREPLFVSAAAGNFRLLPDSPCINAGTNEPWMNGAFDLDGHMRFDRFGGQVDIGAYEYLPDGTLFTVR